MEKIPLQLLEGLLKKLSLGRTGGRSSRGARRPISGPARLLDGLGGLRCGGGSSRVGRGRGAVDRGRARRGAGGALAAVHPSVQRQQPRADQLAQQLLFLRQQPPAATPATSATDDKPVGDVQGLSAAATAARP